MAVVPGRKFFWHPGRCALWWESSSKLCSGIGSWLSGMRRTLRRGAEVIHRKEGKRMSHHSSLSLLGMGAGRGERLQQVAATELGTRLGAEEGR